jgi:hypothetical protein
MTTCLRWASATSQPVYWLQVNLGATHDQSRGNLLAGGNSKHYQIQTSNGVTTWTALYSQTTESGGTESLNVSGSGGTESLNVSGSGRYVCLYTTNPAGPNNLISIWKLQIFESCVGNIQTPTSVLPVHRVARSEPPTRSQLWQWIDPAIPRIVESLDFFREDYTRICETSSQVALSTPEYVRGQPTKSASQADTGELSG